MSMTEPASLADLPFTVGDFLRRVAEAPAPVHVPASARVDRRAAARLLGLGFVAPEIRSGDYVATPAGLLWLEHVGVAEAPEVDANALPLPADLFEQVRALALEAKADPVFVGQALVRRALLALRGERDPAALVTSNANGLLIRRVGALLVWIDVVNACLITNPTQYARTRGIELVPLPPSSIASARGHPPTKGILPDQLEKIAIDHPLDVARIRVTLDAPPAPALVRDPVGCGVYVITCTLTGDVYIGATSNTARRWKKHRQQLKTNQHQCRPLQEQYNTHGDSSFTFALVHEGERKLLRILERQACTRYVNAGTRVLNVNTLMLGHGRRPGF